MNICRSEAELPADPTLTPDPTLTLEKEELAACTGRFSPLLPSEGQALRVSLSRGVPERRPAELRQTDGK